jgi:hypothetical protein
MSINYNELAVFMVGLYIGGFIGIVICLRERKKGGDK